jgi:hypothetical protein
MREYDGRGHSYGFPTVIAERDGKIVGLMATRPNRDDVVECHAVKADSAFIALRLMECYERILRVFDIKGYCFSMSKENRYFMDIALRLPETRQYGESETSIYGLRRIDNVRLPGAACANT